MKETVKAGGVKNKNKNMKKKIIERVANKYKKQIYIENIFYNTQFI